jgi:hydroxyacylglutathione hydrolase
MGMLVAGFPAGSFQTNCYVVAAEPRGEAVVIDPGEDALGGVADACRRHHLKPVAVALTHGHLDHLATVAPLAGAHGIPAWVHPADRHLMTDPLAGLGPELRAMLAAGGGLKLTEPDDVRELADHATLDLAGVTLTVDHTPGHTPGHVTFRTPPGASAYRPSAFHIGSSESATGRATPVLFAGDLVFAGSVGRTDLPGGDTGRLLDSIAARFLTLPDDTVVLPGHGPATTVGAERAANPFLAGLTPAGPPDGR